MSGDTESLDGAKRGLVAILAATVIAGGAGYLLQAIVPLWLNTPDQYLQFGIFWATTFLLVSMVSGLQQEVSRAIQPVKQGMTSSSSAPKTKPAQTLQLAGVIVIAGAILLALSITSIGGERLFYRAPLPLGAALALALAGYVVIAIFLTATGG